jgi:hypothetical protein
MRELVTVLGMNGFTFSEMKIEFGGRDADVMVARTLEVRLDA